MRSFTSFLIVLAFFTNTILPLPQAQADQFQLPVPGVMVALGPEFNPLILKGIKVHPDNPLRFDFILDKGDLNMPSPNALIGDPYQERIKTESIKLIKYFLATLTTPEKDLWVNLSPYEKDRIIPQSFGLTEMGRDLLAEDYMLKQITASLIYPEGEVGKKFWKRIYEEAQKKYGTTNVPINTFNKVWIVPDQAIVHENDQSRIAYIVKSRLKVMLEEDYLSLIKHQSQPGDMALALSPSTLRATASVGQSDPSDLALNLKAPQGINRSTDEVNTLGSQIVREIVIPELTREVNEGKNFAQLRQVYNSCILATWYKKKIKDSILSQAYADKNKVAGVSIDDPQEKDKIYQRYLKAFKKGVYNYIKEDMDPLTQAAVPRKYFSGGVSDLAMRVYRVPVSRGQLLGDISNAPAGNLLEENIDLSMTTQMQVPVAHVDTTKEMAEAFQLANDNSQKEAMSSGVDLFDPFKVVRMRELGEPVNPNTILTQTIDERGVTESIKPIPLEFQAGIGSMPSSPDKVFNYGPNASGSKSVIVWRSGGGMGWENEGIVILDSEIVPNAILIHKGDYSSNYAIGMRVWNKKAKRIDLGLAYVSPSPTESLSELILKIQKSLEYSGYIPLEYTVRFREKDEFRSRIGMSHDQGVEIGLKEYLKRSRSAVVQAVGPVLIKFSLRGPEEVEKAAIDQDGLVVKDKSSGKIERVGWPHDDLDLKSTNPIQPSLFDESMFGSTNEFNNGVLVPAGIHSEQQRAIEIADTIAKLDAIKGFDLPIMQGYSRFEVNLSHLAQRVPTMRDQLENREIAIFSPHSDGIEELPKILLWKRRDSEKGIAIMLNGNSLEKQLLVKLFSLLRGDEFDYDLSHTYKEGRVLHLDRWHDLVQHVNVKSVYQEDIYPQAIQATLSLIEQRIRSSKGAVTNIKVTDIFGGDGTFLQLLHLQILSHFSNEELSRLKMEYWLVDNSREQIQEAVKKLEVLPGHPTVHFLQKNLIAERLDLGHENGMHIVTCIGGGFNMEIVGKKEQALQLSQDVRNALAPGGHLVVAGFTGVILQAKEFIGFHPLNYSVPLNFVEGKHGGQLYVFQKVDESMLTTQRFYLKVITKNEVHEAIAMSKGKDGELKANVIQYLIAKHNVPARAIPKLDLYLEGLGFSEGVMDHEKLFVDLLHEVDKRMMYDYIVKATKEEIPARELRNHIVATIMKDIAIDIVHTDGFYVNAIRQRLNALGFSGQGDFISVQKLIGINKDELTGMIEGLRHKFTSEEVLEKISAEVADKTGADNFYVLRRLEELKIDLKVVQAHSKLLSLDVEKVHRIMRDVQRELKGKEYGNADEGQNEEDDINDFYETLVVMMEIETGASAEDVKQYLSTEMEIDQSKPIKKHNLWNECQRSRLQVRLEGITVKVVRTTLFNLQDTGNRKDALIATIAQEHHVPKGDVEVQLEKLYRDAGGLEKAISQTPSAARLPDNKKRELLVDRLNAGLGEMEGIDTTSQRIKDVEMLKKIITSDTFEKGIESYNNASAIWDATRGRSGAGNGSSEGSDQLQRKDGMRRLALRVLYLIAGDKEIRDIFKDLYGNYADTLQKFESADQTKPSVLTLKARGYFNNLLELFGPDDFRLLKFTSGRVNTGVLSKKVEDLKPKPHSPKQKAYEYLSKAKDTRVTADQVKEFIKELDNAMETSIIHHAPIQGKGGIDLAHAANVLQTQNEGIDIKFHIDAALLAQLRDAPGLTVARITVQTLNKYNIQQFLDMTTAQ